jgi:hypothetical protein
VSTSLSYIKEGYKMWHRSCTNGVSVMWSTLYNGQTTWMTELVHSVWFIIGRFSLLVCYISWSIM